MLARLKPDPPLGEFAAARERLRAVDTPFQALVEKRESARVGLSLSRNQRDAESDRCEAARRQAGDYFALARKRPDKVAAEIADLDYEIESQEPNVVREREIWNVAVRKEATLIAIGMQPRQRAAAEKIGRGLEMLSAGLDEESLVRQDFANASPDQSVSAYLPDCSMELASTGSLSDWGSGASVWARRLKGIGILK
jgi:hypothetical protein